MATPPPGSLPNGGPSDESLWKQYQLLVDLHKHYLGLVLKFNAFYYAITGAVLSYYFANRQYAPLLWVALAFAAVLSLFFAALFVFGAIANRRVRDEFDRIRKRLQLLVFPEAAVLTVALAGSALLFVLVAAGMIALIVWEACHR